MKRSRDFSFTSLLDNNNVDIHDEYASQPNTISFFQDTEDDEVYTLPLLSQPDSSHESKKVRKCKFSSEEDLIIVSAWLNTSLDAIVGTDQKNQKYWERVHAYFEENRQFPSERTANSLMHRWSTIQLTVGKFHGYFIQIEGRNQSGKSEKDKICDAFEMYKTIQKTSFPFIHCWNIFRDAPKFHQKGKLKNKIRFSDSSSPTISSPITDLTVLDDNEHVLERQIGRKTAKECAKQSKMKKNNVVDDTKEILIELRESQNQQREERKVVAAEFLKLEKERDEREKRKEEREQMLYEQSILATDTSNISQYEVEYYTSLKETIIEKRRNIGFTL